MNSGKLIISLVIIVFFFMACALKIPAPAQETTSSLKVAEAEKIATKEGWEAKWESTFEASKKEGRVVVYGGSTAAALKLHATDLVKKKFVIELEILSLRGPEIVAKIRSERRNGLYVIDIYASGSSSIYDVLKPIGAVDPLEPALILPEVLDAKLWFGGELPWGDKEHKAIIWAGHPDAQIIINTDMVKPQEIKSYYDLLDPRWKGKIIINDPTVGSGAAFTGFCAMLYNKQVDVDFFRQLIKNQPVMLRDDHLQINWLVRGRFPVVLWPSTGRLAEYFKAGAPIAWVTTKEGVHLSGGGAGIALMNKAPHPNAARLFLNWLLSREGQLILQNGTDKQSLRIDVPAGKLDPQKIRQPGVKYYPDPNILEAFVLEEYDKYSAMAKEIFDPLLR